MSEVTIVEQIFRIIGTTTKALQSQAIDSQDVVEIAEVNSWIILTFYSLDKQTAYMIFSSLFLRTGESKIKHCTY